MKNIRRKVISATPNSGHLSVKMDCGHMQLIRDLKFGKHPKTTICFYCTRITEAVKNSS